MSVSRLPLDRIEKLLLGSATVKELLEHRLATSAVTISCAKEQLASLDIGKAVEKNTVRRNVSSALSFRDNVSINNPDDAARM
jgi:hypothetical protein